ncbi:MAG: 50S ribosomal protein L29 [Patescibacteria group bacterium]
MDAQDLKKKNRAELEQLTKELAQTIRDLRFKVTTRQVAKVRDLRHAKKDLARVLTLLQTLEKTAPATT